METLKSLLYDQERIVTSLTLSRHANISVGEAAKHLEALYLEDKGTKGLNAVYTLVGFRPGEAAEPTHMLVREVDLEDKKCRFASVQGESIFSLQTREIEDLYDIVTSDDIEDEKFFRSDSGRARIQSTEVSAFKKEKYGTEDIIPVLQSSSAKQATKSSTSIKGQKKEEEVGKQTLLPVKNCLPSTPKGSPAKPIRNSPFSSQEKRTSQRSSEDSNSPIKPKRRTKKILLDDEEDSSPSKKVNSEKSPEDTKVVKNEAPIDKKENKFVLDDGDLYDANVSSPDISPVKEIKKEDTEKKKTKRKAADSKPSVDTKVVNDKAPIDKKENKFVLDDGDLYDANGSSPNVSPVKEIKKEDSEKKKIKRKADSKPPVEKPKEIELRRSPRKKQLSDLPPGKKRVCRRVTETYQDEDGFLVTKEVMREEIVDIPEEELEAKPLVISSKLNKELPENDSKKTAKKAQSKISSFFTKK